MTVDITLLVTCRCVRYGVTESRSCSDATSSILPQIHRDSSPGPIDEKGGNVLSSGKLLGCFICTIYTHRCPLGQSNDENSSPDNPPMIGALPSLSLGGILAECQMI